MNITGIWAVADLASNIIGKLWPDKSDQEKQQLAMPLTMIQGQNDAGLNRDARSRCLPNIRENAGGSGKMSVDDFETAFLRTMGHEGGYANDQHDRGGETYRGISRIYHPSWPGWPKVDAWKLSAETLGLYLDDMVKTFYRQQFWDRFQGDKVAAISMEVACELFDTAVNMNVSRAVTFLQTALNMQNTAGATYPDINVDGKLGAVTISTLSRYLSWQPGNRESNERILLNCMNGEQYIHYKQNQQHERYRGWFARV